MAKKSNGAPKTAASARNIIAATVASPYSHGLDHVARVIDTLDALAKRRQIDPQQHAAGVKYRWAFEAVSAGALASRMDFDRIKGGGSAGAPPSPLALRGAEVLKQALNLLGAVDHGIVESVCGLGHSIEEATRRFDPKKTLTSRDTEYVGRRFRDALTVLALEWHPVSTMNGHVRSFRSPGAEQSTGQAGTRQVEVHTAHAGRSETTYSGDDGG